VKDMDAMRWEDDGGPPMPEPEETAFIVSSGNVWADLCDPDDAECLARAEQRFAEAEAQRAAEER